MKTDPANQKCFETGEPSPQWASVNNGILLSLNTSGVHRGLGVQTSLVRSLSLDMWTEKQLKTLSQGGNAKLAEFFDKYDLRSVKDLKVRYSTKAAVYYRKRNAALAMGQAFEEEPPSYEEGRCSSVDGKSIDGDIKAEKSESD